MVNIEAAEVNDARVVLKSYISWAEKQKQKARQPCPSLRPKLRGPHVPRLSL